MHGTACACVRVCVWLRLAPTPVFVYGYDLTIYALNASNGEVLWTYWPPYDWFGNLWLGDSEVLSAPVHPSRTSVVT